MSHKNTIPTDDAPLLYDRAEAAARLSVSMRTIDELIAKKRIEFCRIGRAIRFRPQALHAFIEANTVR